MKYAKNDPQTTKSEYKVSSFSGGFLTVSEVAQILGKTRKTITEWCRTGKLMATPKEYGGTIAYQVHQQAVEVYLQGQAALEEMKRRKKQISVTEHRPYLEGWKKAASAGLIGKRAYSDNTLNAYEFNLNRYLDKYKLVTFKNMMAELAEWPNHHAKRRLFYRAMVSFAKYLVREEALDPEFLEKALNKDYAPKENPNPKQHVVSEEDLIKLVGACKNRTDRAIILLLASTGMRASELCGLTLEDIDLEKQELKIRQAKWDKARLLGFNKETAIAIQSYLENERPKTSLPYLFLDRRKKQMSRSGVFQRVQRMAKDAGIYAFPHALRSRFVTHNLTMGRNPEDVQKACGHSSITTTIRYNRRKTQEMVDSMKNW
jgi:site-specific recombinase XerD